MAASPKFLQKSFGYAINVTMWGHKVR